VLDAGEIAMSNGGNISAQQVTRVGTPAGLNSAEKSSLSNLDSLSSGQAGTVREHVSNSYFERNGFTSMDGKCGAGNCFDGVYIKGDQVIVNEVKPLNPDGSIKLSPAAGSLPTQGTIQWVESRARELIRSGDPEKVKTGNLILAAKDSGNLTTVVSGVNSNSMVIVKVKP
jgi:filamentous hemagglutinin